MTRMKLQLTRERVRLQNQMECLLEEMRIKLSMVVSNLRGARGLRILRALAKGETDPKKTYGNLIVGTHVQQQDLVGYVTESAEDNDGD
jgi:hypothetical protein